MKNDSLYGPPKEVLEEAPVKKNKKTVELEDEDPEDYIDDEEKEKLGFNSNKMRKYELQKMKYFYAVIHCNNKKTATFPQKVKEVATEVPPNYKFKAAS
jgi:hypothetical protein